MNERDEIASRQESKLGEGVRILKAEEAQAALDAGEAAGRRPDDQLRFGDVPPAPSGPRPAHRFPLPDSVNPAEAVALPPLAQSPGEPPSPRRSSTRLPPKVRGRPSELLTEPALEGNDEDLTGQSRKEDDVTSPQDRGSKRRPAGDRGPSGTVRGPVALAPSGPDDRTTELALGPSVAGEETPGAISLSGSHGDMPHWTDPPTGEVPRLRLDEDFPDLGDGYNQGKVAPGREAHWRDEHSWYEEDILSDLAGDEPPVGALDSSRSEHSDLYSFDEDFERVTSRTGPNPVIDLLDQDDVAVAPRNPSRRELRSKGRSRPQAKVSAADFVAEDEPLGTPGPVEEPPGGLRSPSTVRTDRRGAVRRGVANGSESTGGRLGPTRPSSGRPGQRRGQQISPAEPQDDLRGRVLVGVGLVAALIVAYAVGSKGLVVLAAAVCVVAAAEAYRMVQGAGFSPATLLGLVATAGCVLGAYWKGSEGVVVVTAIAFAGTILWYVLGIVEARPLVNVAVTIMVFVWVGVLGAFAALLLRQPHGKGEFLGAVLVAVAADIAAYFVGRAIGSRPLAPSISPNKTLEGYLGGVIGAIIIGAIVGKAITPWGGMRHGLVLGLLVGLIAPAGDLFESLLKRDLMLKDSGTILGGHGGVLDRFDALLLALPAAYFVVITFKL